MKTTAFILFLIFSASLCYAHTEITHDHKSSDTGHGGPDYDGNYDYTHDGVGNNPNPSTYTKDGVSYYRTHTHQLSTHHINGWKHPGYGDPQYYENPPKDGEKPSIYQHPECYGEGVTHSHTVDIFKHSHGIDHSDLDIIDFKTVAHTHPACEEPINPPIEHPHCYGDGEEHFHRFDANGFWHGIDHNDVGRVGIYTGIHIHPVCKDEKPQDPCHDCKKPTPLNPSYRQSDTLTTAPKGLHPSGHRFGGFIQTQDEVDTEPNCDTFKGYAIEYNDKDQIRITAPEGALYSKLYLWFDNEKNTSYAVLIGYESPKSLTLEQYNTWIDIDTLQIVDYRQVNAKYCVCQNLSVENAVKMVLMVKTKIGLCSAAEYPEPAPSAPSQHRKLTTTWASLKMH